MAKNSPTSTFKTSTKCRKLRCLCTLTNNSINCWYFRISIQNANVGFISVFIDTHSATGRVVSAELYASWRTMYRAATVTWCAYRVFIGSAALRNDAAVPGVATPDSAMVSTHPLSRRMSPSVCHSAISMWSPPPMKTTNFCSPSSSGNVHCSSWRSRKEADRQQEREFDQDLRTKHLDWQFPCRVTVSPCGDLRRIRRKKAKSLQ